MKTLLPSQADSRPLSAAQHDAPLAYHGAVSLRQSLQIHPEGAHPHHLLIAALLESLSEQDVLPDSSVEGPGFLRRVRHGASDLNATLRRRELR